MTNETARKPARTQPASPRPLRYSKMLAVLIEGDLYTAIETTADENEVSKAVVAREWLSEGRRVGGRYVDES